MTLRQAPLLLVLSTIASSGCVNTDTDRVQLSARVENAILAVEQATLVSAINGSFELVLQLGDLASEPTTVEAPPEFDLVSEGDNLLLRRLDVNPSGVEFPVAVGVDDSVRIPFELTDSNSLTPDQTQGLCVAPVVIAAQVRDELAGGAAVSVRSAPIRVAGCP